MDVQKLTDQNPWWTAGKVPDVLRGYKREEYTPLLKSVDLPEVTIITGVRRSGKSTIMYQMVDALITSGYKPDQILFVNLEDAKLTNDSLEDIYNTYRQRINPEEKAFVFLDEIHRREKWEQWIRRQYDLHSGCKFVASGSCSYLLKKEYSTLLTGRNITFEVYPLSFSEFLSFRDIQISIQKAKRGIITTKDKHRIFHALDEYLRYGGFPAVTLRDTFFKSSLLAQYFDDILYKDIIDRYNVNSRKAKDLALYLMTNFTGLISLRSIRSALGLSYTSIYDYLSYFNEAYLIFALEHFSYSYKEQKTMPSKSFCIDGGLRNAVSFTFSKDEGKLVENLVYIELKRRRKHVYYWKGKGEVDFLIKQSDQSLTAINVSYTDHIHEREINTLHECSKAFRKVKNKIIITRDTTKEEDKVQCIPLWKWLLEFM